MLVSGAIKSLSNASKNGRLCKNRTFLGGYWFVLNEFDHSKSDRPGWRFFKMFLSMPERSETIKITR